MFLTTLTPQNSCIFDVKRPSVFVLITAKRAMQNHRRSHDSCTSVFTSATRTVVTCLGAMTSVGFCLPVCLPVVSQEVKTLFQVDESSGKRLLMLGRCSQFLHTLHGPQTHKNRRRKEHIPNSAFQKSET